MRLRTRPPLLTYLLTKRLMHRACHACTSYLSSYRRKRGKGEQLHIAKQSLSVLNNLILAQPQGKHEQALSFLTCEEKGRVDGCTGKAQQRVNAWNRHMHREQSTYSNPTCALHSPFV